MNDSNLGLVRLEAFKRDLQASFPPIKGILITNLGLFNYWWDVNFMLNFSYIIPGVLAGSSFPRGREDLERLIKEGVQVLVTAMEHTLDEDLVNDVGLEYHYIAILPYGTPSLTDINRFVDLVNENRTKNRPVAVHCWMGWGRTGTLLAAYFISEGMSADEAIYRVREKRPNSIETFSQEQILHIYEQSLVFRNQKSLND